MEDYLQKSWRWLSLVALALILLGAGIFIFATLPPRTVVMATGAEGGANHELGIRYREILAQSGVTLQLLPTSGALENLAAARSSVRGKRWLRAGRHHVQEGIAGFRVAWHRVL